MLKTHYLYGALFENLIIAEIFKKQNHSGKQPSVYYWRESNGTEIDCIIEKGNSEIMAIEKKGGATFNKDYLRNLNKFPAMDSSTSKYIIYAATDDVKIDNINLISWNNFPVFLNEFF